MLKELSISKNIPQDAFSAIYQTILIPLTYTSVAACKVFK